MLINILKKSVVNIEILVCSIPLVKEDIKTEIAMCLYYLNKGIDRIIFLENENEELMMALRSAGSKSVKEATNRINNNEVRDRDSKLETNDAKSLQQDNHQG